MMQYPPGDSRMIDKIVHQLKSQGIFDQFRKECLADVDTKVSLLCPQTCNWLVCIILVGYFSYSVAPYFDARDVVITCTEENSVSHKQ